MRAPFNPESSSEGHCHGYGKAGRDAVPGHAPALKNLWSMTWREAQTQTFADVFLTIAVCFLVATLVPLMRKASGYSAGCVARSGAVRRSRPGRNKPASATNPAHAPNANHKVAKLPVLS